jgi:diguanylate cyclase (GGDEF)-like protein
MSLIETFDDHVSGDHISGACCQINPISNQKIPRQSPTLQLLLPLSTHWLYTLLSHNALPSDSPPKINTRFNRQHCQPLITRLKTLCEPITARTPFALLVLELDRFQALQHSLGQRVAEQLSLAFNGRLMQLTQNISLIARLQDNEFAILFEGENAYTVMADFARRVHDCLHNPFSCDGADICLTASIGMTTGEISQHQPNLLLSDAEMAVSQAKMQGGNSSIVLNAILRKQIMEQFHLENDLRLGVRRSEFYLAYQPIVALDSLGLEGFEALVRWKHPDKGCISPGEFIPIAEATGSIIPLGWWVLKEACQQLKIWQSQFPEYSDLTMSVNISGRQFFQSDFIEQLDQILSTTQVDGRYLKLEITETVLMDNAELADSILSQLKARGIHLCLDDFGIGYSSLSYLQRFEVNTLKIDRSFIAQISSNPKSAKILKIILLLAQQLEINVVAEGIETTEQYQQLLALQCQYAQGYLFEKPLSAQEAERLLMDIWWVGFGDRSYTVSGALNPPSHTLEV